MGEIIFTKTRVDIADFHTNLAYFNKTQPIAGVLKLGTEESYLSLYEQVWAHQPEGIEYQKASGGTKAKIFKRLQPFFSHDGFWFWYFGNDQYHMYPRFASKYLVPLQVSLSRRVEYIQNSGFSFNVSPIIKVVLFPFGWSTWLSLLITGDHNLIDLSSFVEYVFRDRSFRLSGNQADLKLKSLFHDISKDTMSDAFEGEHTEESNIRKYLITVTPLARQRGTFSSEALSNQDKLALQSIVNPSGLGNAGFQVLKLKIKPPNEPLYHFMCTDDFGRFTWFYSLLCGKKFDLTRLECYHNNIFRSFLLAFHQIMLLKCARNEQALQPESRRIVQQAVNYLNKPSYKNISLKCLLDREDVKTTLADATSRWPQ
jgi:hypothetical protein